MIRLAGLLVLGRAADDPSGDHPAGTVYWNTTLLKARVFDGSVWADL